MKNRFIDLLRITGRPRIDKLISYLEDETDFFVAPASTKYHGACEGGLLAHSLAVYEQLGKVMKLNNLKCEYESVIITALLHDVCKANFYEAATRNVKNEKTGFWEKVPCIIINDKLPLGHGEKSVIILQQYIDLTIDEIMAIRWHMAGFDDAGRQYGGGQALSTAMSQYPLICALHMADLAANYIDKE